MSNIWKQFEQLLPKDPLLIATVASQLSDGTSVVSFPGGGTAIVKGTSVAVGNKAFIQTGRIQGEAPNLPYSEHEV